jgi:hypothetical protein
MIIKIVEQNNVKHIIDIMALTCDIVKGIIIEDQGSKLSIPPHPALCHGIPPPISHLETEGMIVS